MLQLKRKAKSLISLVLALAIAFSSVAAVPATKASAADSVVVNLNKTYQTIRGFGGINLPEWVGSDMTTAQVNKAFGNGTDQLGLSILRIYVSDDKNQWYRTLATAKTAISKGAIVFATPWNPPASMTETFTRTYTEWNGEVKKQYNQKRLRRDKYADYAQHLNDFVTYMKNNGVNLYAISMANEPDYGHDWTWWTSDECATFLANYAGKINCRVISPESFSYNKEYYNKILNNSAAYNNTDIFGTHFYGTSRANMDFPALEKCGKEIWMTEVYVPNSDANSADRWPEAIQVSENIHNGLVVGNMNAYVWWYIRRGYSPMKEDGTISKRGYCMAQYSKFVRPGDIRVDATESPAKDVYVSAYKGNDNQVVIVAVNKSTTGYSQHFNISNTAIKKVDRYRTSSNENLALTSNMEYSSNGFWSYLPAESVSTFVVTLNGGTSSGSGSEIASGSVYYIKNVHSGLYMDVENGSTANDANIRQWSFNGCDAQKFKLVSAGNGYYYLYTGATGYTKVVDVYGKRTANGTNVAQYKYAGSANQQFKLVKQSDGTYAILTGITGGKSGLDVYEWSTKAGGNINQWEYWGGACQKWILEKAN